MMLVWFEPVACEKIFYVNSYSVINVLNTFQATIVLMSILDRQCMHFDGANKKDEQKFSSSLQPVPFSFYVARS